MIGEIVGNFRLVSKIGRGGMGDVFQGEHVAAGTRVAIKVLKADLSADAEYVQRLFNEARAVSQIRHPGVVQVFDVGFDAKGRAYLAMELLEGQTLGRALMSTKLTLDQVTSIARQTALILEATHAVGITHRDLKPENIFLVPDPEVAGGLRVKVLDFGIAKLTGSLKGNFPTTQVSLGTPAYMAPEQWGDPSKIDGRVDMYALGCVLFEMAAGRTPFVAQTMAEACAAHVGQEPPRVRSFAPHVPIALDTLIDRLLVKSADARALPREVIHVCDTISRGSAATIAAEPMPAGDPRITQPTAFPQRALTPLPSTPPAAMFGEAPVVVGDPGPARPRSNRRVAIGIAAVVLVGGGIAAIALGGGSDSAKPSEDGKIDLRAKHKDSPKPPDNQRMKEAVEAIAKSNPWTEQNGVPILTHYVFDTEYAQYLAALPPEDSQRATPLASFDPTATRPVRWVTWEQAAGFCKAIGGKLLTDDRWETLVGKDSEGKLKFGNGMREWTSSRTNDGRRIVRGAFTELAPDVIESERPWSSNWHTEASNGGRDPIENVASTQISFRCSR